MKVPEGNDQSVESWTASTEKSLVTVALAVDYEVETFYTVVLEVEDYLKSPPATGSVTLKVNVLVSPPPTPRPALLLQPLLLQPLPRHHIHPLSLSRPVSVCVCE